MPFLDSNRIIIFDTFFTWYEPNQNRLYENKEILVMKYEKTKVQIEP